MNSISKNEFAIVGFLMRNFSARHTINELAAKLGISAAGAHAALKKLEKNWVVKAEKLGTGLFYEVKLENKAARHVAAIALLTQNFTTDINFAALELHAKTAIFDGKNLLIISSHPSQIKDIAFREIRNVQLICKEEDTFLDSLRQKEADVLGVLAKGRVLFGEEILLSIIEKVKSIR